MVCSGFGYLELFGPGLCNLICAGLFWWIVCSGLRWSVLVNILPRMGTPCMHWAPTNASLVGHRPLSAAACDLASCTTKHRDNAAYWAFDASQKCYFLSLWCFAKVLLTEPFMHCKSATFWAFMHCKSAAYWAFMHRKSAAYWAFDASQKCYLLSLLCITKVLRTEPPMYRLRAIRIRGLAVHAVECTSKWG
jgi:hypothetical protein